MTYPAAAVMHVDLDAFYASVEQLHNPALRGKPMCVGGGVVLAASYEARAFGVRSAMPIGQARKLCPRLIVVDGHFGEYARLSEEVFEVCRRFTPLVEQISIDEAFLDVSGSAHLLGAPPVMARDLRAQVLDETGLVVSIGLARTKFLAKVASRVAKPDGLEIVEPEREIEFLHALPVGYIWGVGRVTEQKLAGLGIATVGDLAVTGKDVLVSHLGAASGAHLHALAWNRDPRPVVTSRRSKSVGAQSAFGRGGTDGNRRRRVLIDLADRVGGRLRRKDRAARTITVRVRFDDMASITRSTTLHAPVATTPAIAAVAIHLADMGIDEAADGRDINLLGISTSNFVIAPHLQMELPLSDEPDGSGEAAMVRVGSSTERSRHELDLALDALRAKFGTGAVGRASLLGRKEGFVPDEFRDLATHDD